VTDDTAMMDEKSESRSRPLLRLAEVLAAVACVAVPVTACSGSPSAAGHSASPAPGVTRPSDDSPGGSPAAAQTAANRRQLAYSVCMRKHGVPGVPTFLPDITPSPSSTPRQNWNAGAVSGPTPGSPQFVAAQQACRSQMPKPRWVPG
jgi:hypothetical protein